MKKINGAAFNGGNISNVKYNSTITIRYCD